MLPLPRPRSPRPAVPARLAALLVALLAAPPVACTNTPDGAGGEEAPAAAASSDSAFALVQARGADVRGMGVDQATSVHRFDALADGGRIELQRAADDPAGVAQVRRHLRAVAAAFERGDFGTPAFVHMREVPGAAAMAARRRTIAYRYADLPRGGEVRITTRDPAAVRAVHAFLAFQRQDHRVGRE